MDRFGAWPTALAGGVFLFTGWALLYAATLKLIIHIPAVLGIFYAIQQFGSQAAYFAALVGNLKNFKLKHRGTVTGILVSMYGLSAFLVSQLYTHVFDSDPPTLFAFMSVFTIAVCITGACAINTIKPQSTKTAKAMRALALQQSQILLSDDGSIMSDSDMEGPVRYGGVQQNAPSAVGLLEPQPTNIPRYGQLRYLSLIKTVDFWLLCVVAFCTAGAGLTFITAVGSIAESWGLTDGPHAIPASTFTSVLAICNCAGRLLYGIMNDVFRKHVRNVTYLFPMSALICVAHVMMIFWNSAPALFLGGVLTGVSYGGFFATSAVIVNRYFGDENYSSNLGLKTLVLSLSGLIWGQVSGKLAEHFTVGKGHCMGPLCYRYTFVITSSLCVISLIACTILWLRERRDDKRKLDAELMTDNEALSVN